jgi:hypothetical protein
MPSRFNLSILLISVPLVFLSGCGGGGNDETATMRDQIPPVTLSSDYPAALAFDKNGVVSYVVYNFSGQALAVTNSDGHTVNATPFGFTVTTN